MIRGIERFSQRLMLPSELTFKLKSIKYNPNNYNKWVNKIRKNYPILELYHSTSKCNIDNIFREGFHISGRGNKGPGVYVSSHARYCACWGGVSRPAIICHVAGVDGPLKRFRSEIYSPKWSYEYTIDDPSLIYPVCAIWYEINGNIKDNFSWHAGYTPLGSTGCIKCDTTPTYDNKKGVRCDCPLLPSCHPDDIIHLHVNHASCIHW